MNNIELFQEIASIVDKDIIVKQGNGFSADIDSKTIFIPKHYKYEIYGIIGVYNRIDKGFKYYNYCSLYTYAFLHELGHIVNGWYDSIGYALFLDKIKTTTKPIMQLVKEYQMLDEEHYADVWAYEFIKKNKDVIKRLERELN